MLRQLVVATLVALTLLPACGGPETAAPALPSGAVQAAPNDRFTDPELEVDDFVALFEGESREIALERDALVEVCGLQPGMAIADVGAGTGLFLEPFAEAVGPTGRVFAVDISTGFIRHLRERAEAAGWSQVTPVLCTERSAELEEGSVDVIFVCDTYHHFGYPADTLASLHAALVPGGRLVVVDFERIPGVSREWLLGHVRADKATFAAEIREAGFELEREVDVPGLHENYVLVFRRP